MPELNSAAERPSLQGTEAVERAQPVHDPLSKKPIGSPALAAALRAVASKSAAATGR